MNLTFKTTVEQDIAMINRIKFEILKAQEKILCNKKDYEQHTPILNIFGRMVALQSSDVYRPLKKRKGFEAMYQDAVKQVWEV